MLACWLDRSLSGNGVAVEKYHGTGSGAAARYASALLADCGIDRGIGAGADSRATIIAGDPHPDLAWAASGAMALTGPPDAAPRLAPGPIAVCAAGAGAALAQLAGSRILGRLDGAALLGERAALSGLFRQGSVSPGESCRLLRARDGWLALNLARPEDQALLPAWLERVEDREPWEFATRGVAKRRVAALVDRARTMGMPVAPVVAPGASTAGWRRVLARGAAAGNRSGAPRVLDLATLWAGPLCAALLADAGAAVVKVESLGRPDGSRGGNAEFHDLVNARKRSVALAFDSDAGVSQLRRLIAASDIVIESARPRGLAQLGIDAEACVRTQPGLTWVSVTGYGRSLPGGEWVGFGDDTAVAAGLTACGPGSPLFCGDAIADPLTGLHAALAALASWRLGGGALLDLSLRDVVAHALAFDAPSGESEVCPKRGSPEHGTTERGGPEHGDLKFAGSKYAGSKFAGSKFGGSEPGWEVRVGDERRRVAAPRARPPRGSARPLGHDTDDVLSELRC
jgi:hypothetical protein